MARDPFNLPSNRSAADGSTTGNSNAALGASATPSTASTAVPPAPQRRFLGWIQVGALVRKNLLSKWRTPLGTFFEIFSPVLMMLVLVAAYQLSEVTTKSAEQYNQIAVSLPGPYIELVSQAVSFLGGDGDIGGLFSRRMNAKPSRDSTTSPQSFLSSVHGINLLQDLGLSHPVMNHMANRRRLQEEDTGNTTETEDDGVFDFLDGSISQISNILQSPIPVPTFEQFVTASVGISSLIDADKLPIILSDSSFGRAWGNLLTLGTLHLSPNTPVVQDFATYLNATYSNATMAAIKIRVHENENAAVSFINENLNERTWALLDLAKFNDAASGSNENDLSYKIRMNYTTLPNTNEIVSFVSIGLNTQYERYYLSGYLSLQRTLNEFAMSRTPGCGSVTENGESTMTTTSAINMWSMPMPTASYNQNAFFQAVGFLLGLTIAMAFLYPTSRTIKTIVEEKELRLKETLYILGVRPWAHWLSWLITSFILFLIIAVLVTWTLSANILIYSSSAYLVAFFIFFSTATVGFCFVVAACFSRAKLAAIVGPMALFATLLPRFIFFGTNRFEAISSKMWASLLPCTAFAFGADIIADYEYTEVGVQSWNAGEGAYSFNTSIGFLFFDTLLYLFLGWYLELVIPRQYGVARPFYFLVLPSYWKSVFCCCFSSNSSNLRSADASPGVATAAIDDDKAGVATLDFEPVTDPAWIPRVEIQDLVKRYNKNLAAPPAVNHLNLTLYESQITCLLGHNGAGKSSTISVLTGLYPPTSGDCFIYGNSITHSIQEARHSMGVCPQHNVLFDSLTVNEHLTFFQKIKGLEPTKAGLRQSAHEIGLGDYISTTSIALSGGNKRKLSLAIALCGDPQFLLLDEPTSGMDVASRRNCWELLRRKREGRVTLLTTHFLDEASLLADRIAVMKQGKLQCCGSELFLKNRFGLGYNLTVVLVEAECPVPTHASTADDETEGLESGLMRSGPSERKLASRSAEEITAFLNQFIPNTKLIRKSARELTFRFPQGSEASFPDIFDALEESRDALSIGAYGITDTSLEEIFLQLAETEEATSNKVESIDRVPEQVEAAELEGVGKDNELAEATELENREQSDSASEDLVVSRDELHHINPFKQIALLYRKRFIIQRRDLKGACFQIILPVILCGLVLLVLTLDIVLAGPPIEMSIGLYDTGGDGLRAATDIVIGGGMTLETADARRLSMIDDDFRGIKAAFQEQYPMAKFVQLDEATSSDDISQHLLDTYNDHNHNSRYGSFALYDRIDMNISVDWDKLQTDLWRVVDSAVGTEGEVDVGSLLGIDGSFVEFNLTLPAVRDFLAELTNSTENATVTVDTVSLANTTQSVLQRIVDSAFTLDPTGADELRKAFTEFILTINAIQAGGTNETLPDAFTGFLNDILTTVTDGTIQDISDTSVEEVTAVLLSRIEIFDRSVIIDGMLEIFDELLEPYGGNRDTSEAIVELVIATFDGVASAFSNDLTSSPNDLLILPILLLDEFAMELVENFGANATISLSDVFDTIGDILNDGDARDISYLYVKVESATVDLATQKLLMNGIRLEVMSEVLVSDDTLEIDLRSLLNIFGGLLPSGSNTYFRGYNSDVSILHNSSSPHAVGAFNQAYMEYMFKQCTKEPITSRLVSVNHPLPLTEQQAIEVKTVLSVLASLFLLIPLCYIPGAFVVFLVRERMSKSKHLQLVSGVELTSYWISAYLWDLTLFLILTLLLMIVFLIYGRESAVVFVGDIESFVASMALVFGYGLSILPFSYLLSRLFNNHSSAQIAVMGIIFITGFVAVNAYFIMSTIESTKNLAETLRPMFRWWPAYNIGEGFIELSTAYWQREILGSERMPLDWDVAGKPIALNYALAFPYFLYLLLLEYSDDGGAGGPLGRILRQARSAWGKMILRSYGVRKGPDGVSLLLDDGLDEGRGEDDDVIDERTFVKQNRDNLKDSASVLLVNMWKVFPPTVGPFGKMLAWIGKVCKLICCCGCFRRNPIRINGDDEEDKSNFPKRAVRGVSTAIMEGETYGLLGVNGAGKTTTLGVLTGDIAPTGGEAYVAGHDVTGITPGGVAAARKHIGFCPQVDPLLDLMTGRETLHMFGRLRGIPEERLDSTVNVLLDRLTLTPHADKVSESYSGGNKRKLSLGIALIGDPRVLFIDEASSGMDPSTRRKTWELIEQAAVTRSVILTSHSMEEVEALCTRVGIMVKGQFLCLGSVQHLKSKYLDGYTIDAQCEGGSADSEVDTVVNTMLKETLPGSTLAERHGRFLRFDVSSIGLGDTFRKLQELKERTPVVNYSISQCSLEQVFIKLVKSGKADVLLQQQNAEGKSYVEAIDDQHDIESPPDQSVDDGKGAALDDQYRDVDQQQIASDTAPSDGESSECQSDALHLQSKEDSTEADAPQSDFEKDSKQPDL